MSTVPSWLKLKLTKFYKIENSGCTRIVGIQRGANMFLEFSDVIKQKTIASTNRIFRPYPDVFTKMYDFTRANTARAMGYYPYFLGIEEAEGTEVVINGQHQIMLGSNNYLGLTHHPAVLEAGVKALKQYGSGLTGSRFLNGNLFLHERLEAQLATFVGKQKALVFSTGFGVNLGVIAATVGSKDLIFTDAYNHASIIDGARFSKATIHKFRHNDMADLEIKLAEAKADKGRFIVTDGIFSMEGDIINLPGLMASARKHGARVMIDDAHSIGVLGPEGRGTAAHFGLSDSVDLIMGTFSKSLASIGGFIAGDEYVIDYLKHHARTMIYSAALPPANVATVLKALEIIKQEPERRTRVWENTRYMQHEFKNMGYDIGHSETPIVPLIIGDDLKTFSIWKQLLRHGVYTNPVIPDAVPKGRSLLRTSYMATHTRKQLDYCLEQFQNIGRKLKII